MGMLKIKKRKYKRKIYFVYWFFICSWFSITRNFIRKLELIIKIEKYEYKSQELQNKLKI